MRGFRLLVNIPVFLLCFSVGYGAVRLTSFNNDGIPVRNFWQHGSKGIPFVINQNGSKTLSATETFGAVRRAFGAWEAVPTATINFVDLGLTNNTRIAQDEINLVIFDPDGRYLDYPPGSGVIAATLINSDNATGYLTDADIVFNERDFIFTINGEATLNRVDLEGVAVHEIGHFLGLDHTPLTGSATVTPTMNPFVSGQLSIEARTLEPDDIAGVSRIYPSAGVSTTTGVVAGRVLRPDGRPVFGAHVTAHHAATGQFVVSGLSGDSTGRQGVGEYRLTGLPPGEYMLSITPVTGTITEENFGGIYREFDIDFQSEYWDNATDVQSGGVLNISAGQTVENIDFVTGLFAPGFPEIIPGPAAASTFDEAGPYPQTMSVIDNTLLTNAALLYRINNGPEQTVSMEDLGLNLLGNIPGQVQGTTIEYAYEALNSRGNMSRYPTGDSYLSFSILPPPDAPLAYVLMRESNALLVLDTESRETIAQIAVGQDPLAMALSPDQRRLYVVNRLDNSVSVVDMATHRVLATLPTGAGPITALISPDNRFVYVNNSETSTITVIDTEQVLVHRTISLVDVVGPGGTGRLLGFAMSPDAGKLYASDIQDSRLFEIDAVSGSVLRVISTVASPRWIAVSPDGSRLYVTSFDGAGIGVIDAASFQTITTIPTLTVNSTFAMIVAPDGATGYATSFADGKLIVLDLVANRVAETLVTGGQNPRNLQLTPDGKTLYVSNQDSDNLSLFDTATLTLTSLIDVLDGPRGIQIGMPADVITGIDEIAGPAVLPEQFSLQHNFPNPFNPSTTLRFHVPHAARVRLDIYDIQGRHISTLADGAFEPGAHQIQWHGRNSAGHNVASGVYIARMHTAAGFSGASKMLLLR